MSFKLAYNPHDRPIAAADDDHCLGFPLIQLINFSETLVSIFAHIENVNIDPSNVFWTFQTHLELEFANLCYKAGTSSPSIWSPIPPPEPLLIKRKNEQ